MFTRGSVFFHTVFIRHSRNYERIGFIHQNSPIRQCSNECFGQSITYRAFTKFAPLVSVYKDFYKVCLLVSIHKDFTKFALLCQFTGILQSLPSCVRSQRFYKVCPACVVSVHKDFTKFVFLCQFTKIL